jgi:hypothetical protein
VPETTTATAPAISNVRAYSHTGCYNMLRPDEQSLMVALSATVDGTRITVSATFPMDDDDAEAVDLLDACAVLDLLDRRAGEYLFRSNGAEDDAKRAILRAHQHRLSLALVAQERAKLEQELERLAKYERALASLIAEATDDD